ncbi:hypothetical protein AAMO2058_000011200 [Amorphochlora amoebiformis]
MLERLTLARKRGKRRFGKDRWKPGPRQKAQKSQSKKGTSNRTGLMVNVTSCSNASGEIIRGLIKKYGWVEVKSTARCHLLWTDRCTALQNQPFKRLISTEQKATNTFRINRFPGMERFVMKSSLMEHLRFFASIWPEDFNFMPREWRIPFELDEFKGEFSREKTYILKPSNGCQGSGISLAQTWSAVEEYLDDSQRTDHVAQEYISNPMLLGGYKFDLRIYVLVESIEPLKAYVFRDGLARLCTEKYSSPSITNLENAYVHLTNYHVNKENTKYKPVNSYEDMQNSSKRSIKFVLNQLKDYGVSESKFWNDIDRIVSKTLIALSPSIWGAYTQGFRTSEAQVSERKTGERGSLYICTVETNGLGSVPVHAKPSFQSGVTGVIKDSDIVTSQAECKGWVRHSEGWSPKELHGKEVLFKVMERIPGLANTSTSSKCFHILGFDVLLDKAARSWLLEVNAAPSFRLGSPLDNYLKVSLVERSLQIMQFISNGDVRRAEMLKRQLRLQKSLKEQLSVLRTKQRQARQSMLKSQFWERDHLTAKKKEMDFLRTHIRQLVNLQVKADEKMKDLLKSARMLQLSPSNRPEDKTLPEPPTPKRKSHRSPDPNQNSTPNPNPHPTIDLLIQNADIIKRPSNRRKEPVDKKKGTLVRKKEPVAQRRERKRSASTSMVTTILTQSPPGSIRASSGLRNPNKNLQNSMSPLRLNSMSPFSGRKRCTTRTRPSTSGRSNSTRGSYSSPSRSPSTQDWRSRSKNLSLDRPSRGKRGESRSRDSTSVGLGQYSECERFILLERSQGKQKQGNSEEIPTYFEALDFKLIDPLDSFSHLGIFSCPVLRFLYRECWSLERGASSCKYIRVLKRYGIIRDAATRTRCLALFQNLRPRGVSRRERKHEAKFMSYMDFCRMLVLFSMERFPKENCAVAALQRMLTLVSSELAGKATSRI